MLKNLRINKFLNYDVCNQKCNDCANISFGTYSVKQIG